MWHTHLYEGKTITDKFMQRELKYDIAKGIAIILVIVGHGHCISHLTLSFIYSFHMPLFFIIAGYFYHERGIKDSVRKDFRRLMIPYFVFAALAAMKFSMSKGILQGDTQAIIDSIVAMCWMSSSGHHSLLFSDIPTVGIIWFLPTLFVCKNLYNIILRRMTDDRRKLMLVCIFISIAGVAGDILVNLPFGILTGCGALVFYMAGNMLKTYKPTNAILAIGVGIWLACIFKSHLFMGSNRYGCYPLDVIGALAATILTVSFSDKIGKSRVGEYLAWMGRNSMVVLCMHFVTILVDPNTRMGVHDVITWNFIDFMFIIPLTLVCTKCSITKRIFMIR